MSKWRINRMQVHLKTQLRCGDRPLGFVARTLTYVPGHVPIMALVPIIVKSSALANNFDNFKKVEIFLFKHLRFTPFFITFPMEEKELPITTDYKEKVEAFFINSRYGLAIDYRIRGALDSRLYEIESINPVGVNGAPSELVGYMFWRTGHEDELELNEAGKLNGKSLEEWVGLSQWGGERNKGYGYLKNVSRIPDDLLWGGRVDLTKESPSVNWPANTAAPFYLEYNEIMAESIRGGLIPLVGRVYDLKFGFGQACSNHKIVWDVGWKSSKETQIWIHEKSAVLRD